jgi:hypothetical protein
MISLMLELTDHDREILAFEARWAEHDGVKDEAIRSAFGVSSVRYYQLLHAVLEKPAALAAEPMLVKRLRRVRDARVRARQMHEFSRWATRSATPGRVSGVRSQ